MEMTLPRGVTTSLYAARPSGAIPGLHGEVEDTNEAITMPTLSHGAYIAWQLASGEAMHSGHQYIENADVFIGIEPIEEF